jgi:hypothetical protein
MTMEMYLVIHTPVDTQSQAFFFPHYAEAEAKYKALHTCEATLMFQIFENTVEQVWPGDPTTCRPVEFGREIILPF